MIPNHIIDNLASHERIAVLARGGELQFVVHPASEDAAAVRARASCDDAEVLASHLQDRAAILELVASRERDVGGES
ncbi:MAG TPA: hypothetical protein VM597_02830 [Gemmataceae bacterium]|nr:hypothetical protein [Gemmataceae bacterium]